jgi:hypothetical protein
MEKLLKNKWLMLLLGAVVLYLIWRRYGAEFMDPHTDTSEEKAGAMGQVHCQCQGVYNGTCFNLTPWSDCCERKCRKKILSTWD